MVQLYIQLKPHFGRGILLYFRGCFFQFFEGKKKLYIELSQIVELYKTKIHFLVLKVHLSTLSQQNDTEEDEQKIAQTQRPLMFCEPKGQELNTFICSIFWEFFDTPGTPWGCIYIYLEKMLPDPPVCRSNLIHLRKDLCSFALFEEFSLLKVFPLSF